MPIYIYRSGGFGQGPQGPQNPLVRFLISLAVLAVVVGLGILLLPVVGVIALIILGLIAFFVVGGIIYRWIYGNPLDRMRERAEGMRVNPEFKTPRQSQPTYPTGSREEVKMRVRNEVVEDAVEVKEKQ